MYKDTSKNFTIISDLTTNKNSVKSESTNKI